MTIPVLDGVLPRSRNDDPETSLEAGLDARLSASQQQVLSFLTQSFVDEWTLKEFVPAVRWWCEGNGLRTYSEQRYRSAVSELEERGLVVQTGVMRLLDGRRHRVWRLS